MGLTEDKFELPIKNMKECKYLLVSKEEERGCNAFNTILNSIQLISSKWR